MLITGFAQLNSENMAMEKSYVVKETHTRSVTALGYNPARREILMGCEGIFFLRTNYVSKSNIKYFKKKIMLCVCHVLL